MTVNNTSYRETLRSSSMIGGAQAANYLIGLIRVKLVAMLLGPSGIGLIGLYTSAIGLVGTVSGLGVGSSAVREIARASGLDDFSIARVAISLKRVCWTTGVLGWALAIVFREPISAVMTGSTQHADAIAWLGATLMLGTINSGQVALLQGLRRIGDLACANVLSAFAGSIVAIMIYFVLGEAGIVSAMIAVALVTLASSHLFARNVVVLPMTVTWIETWRYFRRLAGLGVAFMFSALAYACLDLMIRSLITRNFGVEGAGNYHAAWALSGVFANFVLSAMGADFYPRLTACIHDPKQATRVVNEQTEIGMLLTLPGLLAVLAFSSHAIEFLYTPQFLPAADLLPWMALGVSGQVLSWPLGYVLIALGASRWFAVTQLLSFSVHALLVVLLTACYGVIGAAYAYTALNGMYLLAMLWVTRRVIKFSWSLEARALIFVSTTLVAIAFGVRFLPWGYVTTVLGGVLTLAGTVVSLRGLGRRLGEGHRLTEWIKKIPGGRYLMSPILSGSSYRS